MVTENGHLPCFIETSSNEQEEIIHRKVREVLNILPLPSCAKSHNNEITKIRELGTTF
jgi:hypothetical protein